MKGLEKNVTAACDYLVENFISEFGTAGVSGRFSRPRSEILFSDDSSFGESSLNQVATLCQRLNTLGVYCSLGREKRRSDLLTKLNAVFVFVNESERIVFQQRDKNTKCVPTFTAITHLLWQKITSKVEGENW